ncbi:FtsX-like permease family protein [Vermiculatibacterium agrestimuris]|uniref:FtsX-like permease family protein n=1 Tax=Vermiculatibacterium agrestimuris TaxID=2941519 RepID=UPI0020405AC1|nr:ABC transporter permease [Vermiculatibacterium agrestimuris]
MSGKLAFRNVRRSIRDYAVYFITLTFGVCLFYVFSALDGQSVMQFLAKNNNPNVEAIFVLVGVFSAFVAVVLAGLILYANQFLMKRRKRELGTYALLGMPTGRVARLLVMETLFIGLAALLSGIALGILGSWALDKLTVAMFLATPGDIFTFSISWAAAGKTALYFGVIFLLVMAFTGVSVSRARLIDLIRSGRTNEEVAQRPLALSVALFLLGVVSLGTAYAILLSRGLLRIDLLWFIMLGLGTLGTFLIFRSLSGFLLRMTKGHAGYYKGLNMFVLRQWSGKVHTNCASNTVISILLLLAMGVTACSVGLNDTITATVGGQTPYDLTVLNYGREGEYEEADIPALFQAAGLDTQACFASVESVTVYYNDETVTGWPEAGVYAAIGLSRYNELMEARKLPLLTEDALPRRTPDAIVNGPAADGIVVVPDAMLSQLRPRRQMVNINYAGNVSQVDDLVRMSLDEAEDFPAGLDIMMNYKLDNYYDLMGAKILVLYMGLYLGLVFLLAAAAVLALQQLSQAADNAARYELLGKLGAPEGMRRKALVSQVALAFLLPLALGVIHTFVGMRAANEIIYSVGHVDSVHASLLTAVFLLVIYGGYFLCTCLGAWRAVKGGKSA